MKILQREDWAIRAIERMKAQKITQDVLCRALGVTPSAISHYLTGRRDPGLEQLSVMAKTLKMSPEELVYGVRHSHPAIPILSWQDIPRRNSKVNAPLEKIASETLPYFSSENAKIYALRIQDDSMFSPLGATQGFRENTIIVVDPTKTSHENQFVIAVCTETQEILLRQYIKTQGKYYLKPINQQYPMLAVNRNIQLKAVVIAQILAYTSGE